MTNKNVENSSMEQVRELLMGTHLKDMETRLQRQEKTFLRELANLRDTMQNRVDSLENFMKNEFASFLRRLQEEKAERTSQSSNEHRERTDAIRAEQKERARCFKEEKKERQEAMKRLDQDLAAKEKEVERKFASVSSSLDAAEQGLRQLILSENVRLTQTLEERYQEVMDSLTNTALQIRHDVVSRSSLSAIFAEAAVRFSEHPADDNTKYAEHESAKAPPAETEEKNRS